ncbi:Acyl-CoA carboxylase epsilon subunit [Austwickia chelonae]|uniref:Acyl-CoA carboxylase epsilon subunit n=1 Tax=Austwickia chelonae NBRC 105200 TaxID=1184607 RepID=K6W4M8_9MICO|nr:acyl-CoA carboxylase epsilon subunit [Austwickia chelonae]GAB76767.1 hypothetical protein AUCHE_02_01290 [Austwickia chelonae NBRC 105200]SEW30404.1 Acyl-CoA carboxylase epsilon subunit [Austwickia chelonae]
MGDDGTRTDEVSFLRVERGRPTEEELAAVAVVLAAVAGGAAQESPLARRGWSHRARTFNTGAVRGSGWGGTS